MDQMRVQRLKRLASVVVWGFAFALASAHLVPSSAPAETGDATQSAATQTSDQMLRDGLDALSDHQPDEARQFFQRIIKLYPRTRASANAERELARLQDGGLQDNGGDSDQSADLISDTPPEPDSKTRNEALRDRTNQQAKRLRQSFVITVGDRVFFAENSANIGGRARAILESQARWLKARPDITVRLIGRADDGGNAAAAATLAAKRGEAVRDKLLEYGVPAVRIVLEPRADQDPIATCRTSLCQAQNRHVETLIGSPGSNMLGGNDSHQADVRKDAAARPADEGRPVAR